MKIDRRTLLAGSAPAFVRAQSVPPGSVPHRNVLFLVADDLGLHTGAYGDPVARTPHLDRLAAEGVRFSHAFCTTASCSASRSVLFTGLHNHANGQYGHAHAEHHFGLLPSVRPMPFLMKEAGYRTGLIGKFHVHPPSAFAWDLLAESEGRNVTAMARQAATFLESSRGRPWYLHVGFSDPHRAAKGFANEKPYPGVTKNAFDPDRIRVPSFLPDIPETRAELAEYYEAANRMDQGVGMLLDLLRSSGQLDNTLVVFLSDNGIPFPNAKTNLYDAGSRLPLIIRAPGQSRRGLVNQAMVGWSDLTPTVLDWANAPKPPYPLHGRSFLPVLEQENPPGWDQVFQSHTYHEITMYYPVRGVRTRRFRYLRNLYPELEFPHASDLWASPTWQALRQSGGRLGQRTLPAYLHRPAEELYDLRADPDEVNNLAAAPEHRATLEALRREVHGFRKKTRDPWLINDREGPFSSLG
jgi:N-sulfoglucosamine sulfohydrolase